MSTSSGARREQVWFDHVAALHQATVGVSHVTRQESTEFTHRAHPSQASDGVGLAGKPGRADATEHLGHR